MEEGPARWRGEEKKEKTFGSRFLFMQATHDELMVA